MNSPSSTESAASTTPPPTSAGNAKRRFRWWPAPAVLLLGVIAQQVTWKLFESDRTFQVMGVMGAVAGTLVGLLLWWFFFSRLRWRTKFAGLVGVTAGVLTFWFSAIRLEGFTGEMFPRLAWKWTKSSEERLAEFQRSTSLAAPSTTIAIEDRNRPLIATDEDWSGYRGPNRDGIVLHSPIRRDWDSHPPKLLWKRPVGPAWSAFTIVDGLAFTQEQRQGDEAVVCYDAQTGEQLWVHTDPVRFVHAVGGDGPRATPVFYDRLLYTIGATGILNCLKPRTGETVWSHDTLAETGATNVEWGTSGSPLIFDDAVIVNPGGPNGKGVVAYGASTGKEIWSGGSDPASYCAPQLCEIKGIRQVLIFDAVGLAGHATDDGRQLWKFPWTNGPKVNAAQPIVLEKLGDDLVFFGSGYAVGSAVIRISRDHDSQNWLAAPVCQSKKLKLKFNCAIERDGYIYGLDEGILCCFEADGLKQTWKGGRYGYGQFLLVDDVLLVQAESGEVALVAADPKAFRELVRFRALESKTWNNPALCRGRLYVRNGEEAACYDIAATTSDPSKDTAP